MKKIFLTLISSIFILMIGICPANADSVVLKDGSVVDGRIVNVAGGLVEIKTKTGMQKLYRSVGIGKARDIVEYGFLIKRRIMGEVFFATGSSVEIATSTGNVEINRLLVRQIILSEQTPVEAPSAD